MAPNTSSTARSTRVAEPDSSSGLRRSRWLSAIGAMRRSCGVADLALALRGSPARARRGSGSVRRADRRCRARDRARVALSSAASGVAIGARRARARRRSRLRSLRSSPAHFFEEGVGVALEGVAPLDHLDPASECPPASRTSTARPKRSSSCGRNSPSSGLPLPISTKRAGWRTLRPSRSTTLSPEAATSSSRSTR